MGNDIRAALETLIYAAREQYGDSAGTPGSAYRFSIRDDGAALEIFKSPLHWRVVPFAVEEKKAAE